MNFTGVLDVFKPSGGSGGSGSRGRLKFRSKGQAVPSSVKYDGEMLHVTHNSADGPNATLYAICGINRGGSFHITPTGRLVFDSKRAETRARRRKRERDEAKTKRRSTKLSEYVGKASKRLQGRGHERAIAKDRKTQRSRERWVLRTGIWRLGKTLGLWDRTTVKIVPRHKEEGFDFDIVSLVTGLVVFRVDAKGQFITTPAQDVQVKQGWTSGIRHFLLNYNKYKECRQDGIRESNGSIWK